MGVASGCSEQEAGVASGSGWNLWVWLLGVVLRRYIDFLILLIPTPRGGSRGGLRGLEHPPRSKFRFQRELTGVINSFSSAKTHCREPTARSITTTPTMSMSMRIAKARGYDFVFLTMSLSGADLEAPLS